MKTGPVIIFSIVFVLGVAGLLYKSLFQWILSPSPADDIDALLVIQPNLRSQMSNTVVNHPDQMVKMTVMTPKGAKEIMIQVHYDWAPLGAARFVDLVKEQYYDECRFFRVIKNFIAQFGINGNPAISATMSHGPLKDDKVLQSNTKGTVTFAHGGKNTRSTQIFFNLRDNAYLDKQDFSPFGEVVKGLDVLNELYSEYGEGGVGDGTDGKGPAQGRIHREGNEYLDKNFPKLSFIVKAELVAP